MNELVLIDDTGSKLNCTWNNTYSTANAAFDL